MFQNICLHEDIPDTFIWKPSSIGVYSTKTFIKWLDHDNTILNTREESRARTTPNAPPAPPPVIHPPTTSSTTGKPFSSSSQQEHLV